MTILVKDNFSFKVYRMIGESSDLELSKKSFEEYIEENPYESFVNSFEDTKSFFMPLIDNDEIAFSCSVGNVVGLKYSVFSKKIPREVLSRACDEAIQKELESKKAEEINFDEIREEVTKQLYYGRSYSENHISMIIDWDNGLFFIENKSSLYKTVEMFFHLFKLQLQPFSLIEDSEEKTKFLNWLYVEGSRIGYERSNLFNKKNDLLKDKTKEEELKVVELEIENAPNFELDGNVSLSTEKLRVRASGDIKSFITALETIMNGAKVTSISLSHKTKARQLYYDVETNESCFYNASASYVQKIKSKDIDSGFITSDQIIETRYTLFYQTVRHYEKILDIYRKSN